MFDTSLLQIATLALLVGAGLYLWRLKRRFSQVLGDTIKRAVFTWALTTEKQVIDGKEQTVVIPSKQLINTLQLILPVVIGSVIAWGKANIKLKPGSGGGPGGLQGMAIEGLIKQLPKEIQPIVAILAPYIQPIIESFRKGGKPPETPDPGSGGSGSNTGNPFLGELKRP